MFRRVSLSAVLVTACAPPGPSPAGTSSAPFATATARPREPTLALKDWREDSRVTTHLQPPHGGSGELDERPPDAIEATPIVDDPDVSIEAVRSIWTDHDGSAGHTRIYRVYLLVRRVERAHVVELAHQYWNPNDEPPSPRVEVVQWNGAGAEGPDLVLTVATESVFATQCDDGRDARTDVIVCELDPGSMRCGRAPVELEFFDGCAGGEVYDRVPERPPWEGEDEPCGRVSFSATWTAQPTELRVSIDHHNDVDCLDSESAGTLGAPRPPAVTMPYATLLADPSALRTVDIEPRFGETVEARDG